MAGDGAPAQASGGRPPFRVSIDCMGKGNPYSLANAASAVLRKPRGTAPRRSFPLTAIVAMTIACWTSSARAASKGAPAAKEQVEQLPWKTGDEKALVSVSGMAAPDFAACVADLRSSKVAFEPVNTATDAGCELSGAVRLVSVATPFGDVAIAGKPTMLCSFARRFSAWSRDVAAPLTLGYTGQRLTEIEVGSAFACRARYDKPGAIPSEHAKGNAIDISSFVLADSRRIRVKQPESDMPLAHDLAQALRTTACGYFTTVLGPGADPAHAEHFHLDLATHGSTAYYRICE